MKKRKILLNALKVQSFVTSFDNQESIRGGSGIICSEEVICPSQSRCDSCPEICGNSVGPGCPTETFNCYCPI